MRESTVSIHATKGKYSIITTQEVDISTEFCFKINK